MYLIFSLFERISTIWSSKSTSGHIPKELKAGARRHIYTHIFIAAPFTTAKRQKQPKCFTDESIIKMWYKYAMEYYSAVKRREIPTHASTQMNPENIVLNEKSQSQKTNTVWFHLCEVPRGGKFIGMERGRVLAKGWEDGKSGESL